MGTCSVAWLETLVRDRVVCFGSVHTLHGRVAENGLLYNGVVGHVVGKGLVY